MFIYNTFTILLEKFNDALTIFDNDVW